MLDLFLKNMSNTQPANIGPQDVLRTKDPKGSSRGHPNLTSLRHCEMTSSGCSNLTFKERPWEVDSERVQDFLRTSLRVLFRVLKRAYFSIFSRFSFRTYSINQIYLKAFQYLRCIENTVKLRRWSIFCKISHWLFSR